MIDWHSIAASVCSAFPLSRIPSAVLRVIEETKGQDAWVASSGGIDSLCLLLLLYGHFNKHQQIHVLHFNYKLWGESDEEDARFVHSVADALDYDYVEGSLPAIYRSSIDCNEAFLREHRHAFFKQALDGSKGSLLYLGHQKEDILETLLMRLARGSGTTGMAAPRPVQYFSDGRVYLRPLLNIRKSEIKPLFEALRVPWAEDPTNTSLRHFRNRVRHELIPKFSTLAPTDLFQAAYRTRTLLEEDDDALSFWLSESFKENPCTPKHWDLQSFKNKPRALIRRALQKWLSMEAIHLEAASFDALLDAVILGNPCRYSATSGQWIYFDGSYIHHLWIVSSDFYPPLPLPYGGTIAWPNGASLQCQYVMLEPSLREVILQGKIDGKACAFVAPPENNASLMVRNWEKGDRYQPLGSCYSKKVQDMFVDSKMPKELRAQLPFICTLQNAIIWVPGLLPADTHKINSNTPYALMLTYSKTS